MTPDDVRDREIPHFPARAPQVMSDPAAIRPLFTEVLSALAEVVDVPDGTLTAATPCASCSVGELRDHVLGWLQHFALVLHDTGTTAARPDPGEYRAAADPRDPRTSSARRPRGSTGRSSAERPDAAR